MAKLRVLIMGAAGRDFHNFNMVFRDNEAYDVVAFTATQIPNIDGRRYPAELAGPHYPQGIPIYPETELSRLLPSQNPTHKRQRKSNTRRTSFAGTGTDGMSSLVEIRPISPRE